MSDLMQSGPIQQASLCDAADALERRDISAVELAELSLNQAQQLQSTLNCFIHINPELALLQAQQVDDARARGDAVGPLAGVPLAHKDMFYRAGEVCSCGSKIRQDFVPDVTATVLQRLDDAGAVTLGTLNMAEFATGPTGHNVHFGACRNPWNTAHVTGGSSSGSGSATAARVVFGALGSDTGGSIRLPAAACGLFGIKPTQTRVSRFGCMGLSYSLDNVGPLARTARDCARLLGVIAGRDDKDSTSSHFAVADYERATMNPDVRGLRIGVPKQYFREHLEAEVEAGLDDALEVYRSLGAEIVSVEIPFADVMGAIGGPISGVEALALHRAWMRDRPQDYGPQTIARHMTNLAIPAADYLASVQARPRILREFVNSVFSACDVLQVPVFNTVLPTIADTDVGDSQGFDTLLARITRNTRPINFLALPGLSVPAGFTNTGLPLSFQLVGRPFAEARLFRAGAAYEAATKWTQRAPSVVTSAG
jgi:aspartyl-tRNA(Asn)/glutamyl-tRNA(Gln) amidotransferase subunit A